MLIEFDEEVNLPPERIYAYFRSPVDWARLFPAFGKVEDRGEGWYAVSLRSFPFPLVAKITRDDPNETVAWSFRSFWRGQGEVKLVSRGGRTRVQGYERISIRVLPFVSPLIERLFLERRFRRLWSSGWHRLRRMADEGREALGAVSPVAIEDAAQPGVAPDGRPRTAARR